MYQPPERVRRPIPEILRSWPNPGLWNDLECDGDGWWIEDALHNGSLYLVSGKKLECTWVERSSSASNYRGEILGALGYILIMRGSS